MGRIAFLMLNQIPEVIQTVQVRDLDAIGTSGRVFFAMEVEKEGLETP
jgi:hypothetical protein